MENIVVNNSKYANGRQSDFGSDGVGSTPTLEIYKCFFCGKEYKTKQALGSHTGKCKQNPNATNAELTEAQRNRNKLKPKGFNLVEVDTTCEYCGKFFKYSCHKTQHIKFFCIKNPNNIDTREAYAKKRKEIQQEAWKNPKLRKEQSERTVFNNFWKYRSENPIIYESKIAGKIKLDSNWELLVAKHLDELNVEWFRPRVRLPYFDSEGVEHGYFPDFYIKTFNCFIEVKSDFIAEFQNSNNKCEYIKEHYPFIKWITTENDCSTFSLSDLKCDFVPQKDEEDISYWLSKIEQKEKCKKQQIINKDKYEKQPVIKKEKCKKEQSKIDKKQYLLEKHKKELKLLQESGIDFSKQGWVSEARVLLGWSTNKVGNYIRKNYPELKVFTRKK